AVSSLRRSAIGVVLFYFDLAVLADALRRPVLRAPFALAAANLDLTLRLTFPLALPDAFCLILGLTLLEVMVQPFQLRSKMMPFGSLNLRSKSSSSGSPRSKKNLPPAFSMRFCCPSKSSHWKPK